MSTELPAELIANLQGATDALQLAASQYHGKINEINANFLEQKEGIEARVKKVGFYAVANNEAWRYPASAGYGNDQWIKYDSEFLGAEFTLFGDDAGKTQFDVVTGEFTAQIRGYYYFNLGLYARNDTNVTDGHFYPGFAINGDTTLKTGIQPYRMFAYGTPQHYPDGVDVGDILFLEPGDKVSVQIYFRTNNVTRIFSAYSKFSGVFIGGVV